MSEINAGEPRIVDAASTLTGESVTIDLWGEKYTFPPVTKTQMEAIEHLFIPTDQTEGTDHERTDQ